MYMYMYREKAIVSVINDQFYLHVYLNIAMSTIILVMFYCYEMNIFALKYQHYCASLNTCK